MRRWLIVSMFSALIVAPAVAAADDVPKGTLGGDTATKGNTDITGTGFQTGPKADDKKAKDATELSLSFGGLYVSGNAELLALTGATAFRLRRGDDQLSAGAAINYSTGSTNPATTPVASTVDNQQGRVRYDRFLTDQFAVFLGVQARRDRFIGVDLRLQVDPGAAYYFINEKAVQFWAELGYDFLYDIRRDDALTQPDGTVLAKTNAVHGARAFLGYKHKFDDSVSLSGALEFLQGISDTDARRLGGDFSVTSKLYKKLSLATAFSFRHDAKPLPGKQNLDTTTSLNLVLSLL